LGINGKRESALEADNVGPRMAEPVVEAEGREKFRDLRSHDTFLG